MNPSLKRLLSELSDECRIYMRLVEQLEQATTRAEYEAIEQELYASLTHLQGHAQVMLEESLPKLSEFKGELVK
jgi:hypothetical protein